MKIEISEKLSLELLAPHHAESIFQIANLNREYLGEWLLWLDQMHDVDFIKSYIESTIEKRLAGLEYAFVILYQNEIVGRIGVYQIDLQNDIGEIGYWINEAHQGLGIVTTCTMSLVKYSFETLQLNRVEIKCGVENTKSQKIAENLNFTKEGIMREAKKMRKGYIDLVLYSKIKKSC